MEFQIGETLYFVGTGTSCTFMGYVKEDDGQMRGYLSEDGGKPKAYHISHFLHGFVTPNPEEIDNKMYLKKTGQYPLCFGQNCYNIAGVNTYCKPCREERKEYFKQKYKESRK